MLPWLETIGFVCMWVVTVLRAPAALRDRGQRDLWLAVALIALTTTLYQDPISEGLSRIVGGPLHLIDLGRNLCDVAASTVLIHLVLGAALRRQHIKPLFAAAALMMALLIFFDLTSPPHGHFNGRTPQIPVLCWYLLMGYHLIADAIVVAVCWRYWRRAREWSVRWGLFIFGIGAAFACVLWMVFISYLITPVPAILSYVPPVTGIEEILQAVGAGLPIAPAVYLWAKNCGRSWILWPLWVELVTATPQVTLMRPRFRVVDTMTAVFSPELRLYRMVIEIRDALLILTDHIAPSAIDHVRRTVENSRPEHVDALTAACLIHAAQRARRHSRTHPQTLNMAELGGEDLEAELTFLLHVTRARNSALVKDFVDQLTPAGSVVVQ
ncbi:MAB_1171c family putative transporter [Nocardia sp. NPDC051570]|uniref:MAB_1171c family putative transporter n=1 Tax=Nocardia sp. NPDC051570 TaxID=3364324 RepID=UPI003791B3CA